MKSKNPADRQKKQAEKRERRQKRKNKGHSKKWQKAQAIRAKKEPQPEPRASGYLVTRFWEYFQFDKVLERFNVVKYKGLPLATLLVVLISFGLMNATSDADLCEKVKAEPLLLEMCGVELLDKQQLYRLRKGLSIEVSDGLLEQLLRALQKDPRTASRPDGVVIGDDTVMLKYGQQMAGITVVYKSSEGRYGWGYVLPSTHYADADKDYPLWFTVHQRTEEQQQEAADKRWRRKKGLDRRRTEDEKVWLSQVVSEERQPEVVVLRGSHLSPGLTGHCEQLQVAWIGVSPRTRKYDLGQKTAQSAKTLLKRPPPGVAWQTLNDEGLRVAWVGAATTTSLGQVTLLVAEPMSEGEGTVYVLPADTDEATAIERLQAAWRVEQPRPDNSKLHDMVALLQKSRDVIQAQTATFDRWFHVPWFIQSVLDLGFKRVVIKAKADRLYTAHGQSQNWQAWQATLSTYHRHTVLGQAVNLARLKLLDPDLGWVQLVFVQEIRRLRRHGRWVEKIGQCYALMCTDPAWNMEKVFQAHKLRWKIEEFYREARQNHALTRFHCRSEAAIHGHLVFAFISYICVALVRLWDTKLKDKSLGWIKRTLFQGIVELRHTSDTILVAFSPAWIDRYGLPDFCLHYSFLGAAPGT